MFGIVPKPLWSRLAECDERNRITLGQNCLLLEGGGQVVLVEAGIGDKQSDKLRDIYAQERRTVVDALREAGKRPEDVTTVVVTHLHFDHAGGLTRLDEDGRAVPTFPNAEVVTQRTEWEDAMANKSTMHSTYLRDHLDPIADRVRLVEGEADVPGLPGIRVEPSPGHTWGQQSVWFEDDGGRTVVFPGDLVPTVHHAAPTHGMAYDVMPYESMIRKQRFLRRAFDDGLLIVLDHEPGAPVVRAHEREGKAGQFELRPDGAP